jgi:formylmethanofuran dehydrogenase subunit E
MHRLEKNILHHANKRREQRKLNKYICSYCHEFVNKVYYNKEKDNDFCINCN